jgi:hypothetical protein
MKRTLQSDPKKPMSLLILLLALVVASCASSESREKKQEEVLRASVDTFNSAFKWEDYIQAAVFVAPDKKQLFWEQADKFKGKIRLTDYELREVELKDKGATATAILHFQYWRLDSPTLRSITLTQKWYYTSKDKQWRVSESGYSAITRGQKSF